MPITFKACFLAVVTAACASAVTAQTQEARPVMSAPYVVDDARAAFDEIRSRWLIAQADQQARYSAFEGNLEDFVRSDPVLQAVSWPYGTCTDMLSLIPPPLEGWGLRSDAPFTANPVEDIRAEVSMVTYNQDLTSDDPDFHASERSIYITVGVSPDSKAFWDMALSQPAMRDAMLEPGPYNYPVTIMGGGVLLGDVLVSIDASDEADRLAYLETMIRCAVSNGMIAQGIDPTTLREDP